MNEVDKGYLAAILDGEGSVHVSKPNRKKFIITRLIFASNTDINIINKIEIILRKNGYHPVKTIADARNDKKKGWKDLHRIRLNRKEEIKTIIPEIIKFSSAKKERLKSLLNIINHKEIEYNYYNIRNLNIRGKYMYE